MRNATLHDRCLGSRTLRRSGIVAIVLALAAACASAQAPTLSIPGSQAFTQRGSALADDAIDDIAVSPANEIWVATAQGITIVGSDAVMRSSSWHGREFCHQVEFAPDGTPWVHCSTANLSTRDGSTWTGLKLPVEGYSIADVAIDGQAKLWVATNLGLFARLGSDWISVQLPHSGILDWSAVSCVAAGPGRFMLAHIALYGVVRIDTETLEHESILAHRDPGCPLRIDRAGNAWFGTRRGLYRVTDAGTASLAENETPFADFQILDIAIDKSDRPWVSTRNGGIHAFDGTNWITVAPEQANLDDDHFGSLPLAFDAEGNLWAAGTVIHFFSAAEGTGLLRIPRSALPLEP